jgi:heptosyltransferase-2
VKDAILVKLPNWMGDILFSYDLLYTLGNHFKRVGLITSSDHAGLFEAFPQPNTELITYPAEEWPRLSAVTRKRIKDFGAQACLLLPNSFGAALVLRRAGISQLYGYRSEHRSFLLKKSISMPERKMHQRDYFLHLLRLFELQPLEYQQADSAPREALAIIHPGASKRPRAWHLERFAKVAEGLRAAGMEVVFVSGERVRVGPFRVVEKPSLPEFCGLLRRCSLFIGNDSGPLHLAQQCGAPVVGIYGPGDPNITGPRSRSPFRVVYHAFPCSPCKQNFFKECSPAPSDKPFCIETIQPEEVLKAAMELLPNYGGRASVPAS